MITDKEFINRIWPQNCGDSLKVIEKSNLKKTFSNGKIGHNFLFKCEFQKYHFVIYRGKDEILKGNVLNPLIEKYEFLDKIWPQHCGDSLKIIEKIEKGKYKCQFQKYFYLGIFGKKEIISGKCLNPQIEKVEFVDKIWHQNCGDDLKILEKTNLRGNNGKGNFLFKCEFIKYPYIIYRPKVDIIKGECLNPLIEDKEFLNKIFVQNEGFSLKVLEKIKQKSKNKLFRCQFLEYPCEVIKRKDEILTGQVTNPNCPWKTKIKLHNFIKNNFKEKPTILELASLLNKTSSFISQIINKYNLQKNIYYQENKTQGEEDIYRFIKSFYFKEINCNSWILKDREIDIYLPDLKLGFEFNGIYWHSQEFKDKNYHLDKLKLANSKGIKLCYIWEDEWNNNQQEIEQWIKDIILKGHSDLYKNNLDKQGIWNLFYKEPQLIKRKVNSAIYFCWNCGNRYD